MSPTPDPFAAIAQPLGWCYLAFAAANAAAAYKAGRRRLGLAAAWTAVGAAFCWLGIRSVAGHPVGLPEGLKDAIDATLGPVTLTLASFGLLAALYGFREKLVRPAWAWAGLNTAVAFLGLSLVDADFAAIVLKPDNVAIAAMIFLLGFFTWLGASQAVENDRRKERGEQTVEADFREKTLVWPDLVYIELIAMVILSAVLLAWSIVLKAPLEQPANPVVTPNPAKAPWYFLGLQEMLVFFDPTIAGVVIPLLIIVGLAAIPYLDRNPKGSGYYTIAERKFAHAVFLFGFLQLWILLIVIGVFFRGPNWNFYGLYQTRDPHLLIAQNNSKLSELVWLAALERPTPQVDPPVRPGFAAIVLRELPGLVVLALYFVALPMILARTRLKWLRVELGRFKYCFTAFLLLMMLALPLKMLLRWTANISYIVSFPEWFVGF